MKRNLTDNEIHELLEKECYAHLACCESVKRPYLVPITYVYHKNALYCFSFKGKKIDIMRKHPHVCLQIEKLREPDGWRSAMLWGTYEELGGKDREQAMSLILERLWKESNRDHPIFIPFRNSPEAMKTTREEKNVILYRIVITERSGRMEHYE